MTEGVGRLEGRTAVVIGAGQTPGETMGNGRAVSLRYAEEGAHVVAVDRRLAFAQQTVEAIEAGGGTAEAVEADATDESQVAALLRRCHGDHGGIDVLHNNVGVSLAGGDAILEDITVEAFDRVLAINLRAMVVACKHAVPFMRSQGSGVITNISSVAAIIDYPYVAYQTSKAGVVALTRNIAIRQAPHGIRANTILPGLMDTPMAIESRVAGGRSRDEVRAERDAHVPLGGRMGSAWDVANAAVFLASEEARFITGVALPVDGGQSLRIG